MIENGIERADCRVHLPNDIEYKSPDGVFMKGMIMAKRGTVVSQHAHQYSHTSLLARGSVILKREDANEKWSGTSIHHAPAFIEIPAKTKHWFESLEDDTHIYCIHNMSDYHLLYDEPSVHEENNELPKVA